MSYKPKVKNTHYRIRFFQVKGLLKKYIDTSADMATHFQVYINNKKENEFKNLKDAIDLIIEYEGHNQELDKLIDNLYYVQNPTAIFITDGIIYTKKHGARVEHKIRA